MNRYVLTIALLSLTGTAFADTCLQTDKQGTAGDSRYYDYGKCASNSTSASQGAALAAIASQMQMFMPKAADPSDRGYSDAERSANVRAIQEFQKGFVERRNRVTTGAWVDLYGRDLARYRAQNTDIPAADKDRIRAAIGTAIHDGTLLTAYPEVAYENPANAPTWASTNPETRWQTCEVATQLVRALGFGDFVTPEQVDHAKAFAIAQAGYPSRCGGTSYWLGRIYELGDDFTKGVNKKIKEFPQDSITEAYDVAILNGMPQAYERIAELYRVGGPPRYRGKSGWSLSPGDDQMFMKAFEYRKCLEFDPANLVCARGLRDSYADTKKNADFTMYDKDKAEFYAGYVQKLEGLLSAQAQAGK